MEKNFVRKEEVESAMMEVIRIGRIRRLDWIRFVADLLKCTHGAILVYLDDIIFEKTGNFQIIRISRGFYKIGEAPITTRNEAYKKWLDEQGDEMVTDI